MPPSVRRQSTPKPGFLKCPACRAQQVYSKQCRRCQADLRLLVAALSKRDRLVKDFRFAREQRDQIAAQQCAAELVHLKPIAEHWEMLRISLFH